VQTPYTPEQRRIFPYFDGTAERLGDPLEIQMALGAACPDLGRHLKAVRASATVPADVRAKLAAAEGDGPAPVAVDLAAKTYESVKALVAATRTAFGVAEVTADAAAPGGFRGLTSAECLDLFARFMAYVAELEAAARPLASSPGSTDSSPAA